MKAVLIYAGTTEGRLLAEKLAKEGIPSEVCVATEYGRQVMQEEGARENVHLRQGRLLSDEMRAMVMEGDYLAVVDCTHPYATVVTENIRKSMEGIGIPLFRLSRDLREMTEDCTFFSSSRECAEKLKGLEGRFLLTTGSKELSYFCGQEELRRRLVVRVLPGRESLELCYQNGLEGKQILAMQGPFSKEMNLATIHQYGITGLVTKESGRVGGFSEKLEAAREAGIPCYVIRKPASEQEQGGLSFAETFEAVFSLAYPEGREREAAPLASLDIVLAGIGMGAEKYRTMELERRLGETDYLFGAERMLGGMTARKGCFPYYLERDVLPCLKQLQREALEDLKITILFSGDCGFYSGAEKMLSALQGMPGVTVRILPGISSVSALSAKFGIRWQDCMILSAHGTAKESWKAELLHGARRGRKIFFLTSGPEDVREIGALLVEQGLADAYALKVGYQLSYAEEELLELRPQEAQSVTKPGLYAGFLIPPNPAKNGKTIKADGPWGQITPGYSDEVFLRGEVPMTKEEVRTISICKLKLTEDALVYDVGSGTGSIAIEIAALAPGIMVYAVECKPEAVSLIQKNRERFGACRVQVVEGMAPQALEKLPVPTHAFLGGSRGNLKEILAALYEKNPRMRIVMNAISLESLSQMQEMTKAYPITDLDITTVSVSKARKVGGYHLMQAGNPVTIFSFTFCERGETDA